MTVPYKISRCLLVPVFFALSPAVWAERPPAHSQGDLSLAVGKKASLVQLQEHTQSPPDWALAGRRVAFKGGYKKYFADAAKHVKENRPMLQRLMSMPTSTALGTVGNDATEGAGRGSIREGSRQSQRNSPVGPDGEVTMNMLKDLYDTFGRGNMPNEGFLEHDGRDAETGWKIKWDFSEPDGEDAKGIPVLGGAGIAVESWNDIAPVKSDSDASLYEQYSLFRNSLEAHTRVHQNSDLFTVGADSFKKKEAVDSALLKYGRGIDVLAQAAREGRDAAGAKQNTKGLDEIKDDLANLKEHVYPKPWQPDVPPPARHAWDPRNLFSSAPAEPRSARAATTDNHWGSRSAAAQVAARRSSLSQLD